MKLLICTQAVDTRDPVLGFFVRWIEEFAKHVESIEVICLYRGDYQLPANVRVHSLGKERGSVNRATYAWRFLMLAWRLRSHYDAAFVHMNQEYVLIAAWLWKLLGKRVYLWRNHYAGSWLTNLAVVFCTKVFCTSKHSYTARFKRTVFMPVGVDTKRFMPNESVARVPRSILFLARIAPSKRVEMLVDALRVLKKNNEKFFATIVGSPLPEHEAYYASLVRKVQEQGMSDCITFRPGVTNHEASALYQSHEIFVNTSPSGMLDKTIFEAAACGCVVLAASEDWQELVGDSHFFTDGLVLAERLNTCAKTLGSRDRGNQQSAVFAHSLVALAERLRNEL